MKPLRYPVASQLAHLATSSSTQPPKARPSSLTATSSHGRDRFAAAKIIKSQQVKLTPLEIVFRLQDQYWQGGSLLQTKATSTEFWRKAAEDIRSPSSIRLHLLTYSPRELHSAFRSRLSQLKRLSGLPEEASQIRAVIARHLVEELRDGSTLANEVDHSVHAVSCLYLNRSVLTPLAAEDKKVRVDGINTFLARNLTVCCSKQLWTYDLFDKSNVGAAIVFSGSFEDVLKKLLPSATS